MTLSRLTFRSMPGWLLALCLGAAFLAVTVDARAADQVVFKTPDEAVKALVAAARAGDVERLKALFGPGGEDIVDSGDPVQDDNDRKAFVRAFRARHKLTADSEDRRLLSVGVNDFQLPTPLKRVPGGWVWDGAAGAEELVYERIGRNELGAIATLEGAVDAEIDYRNMNPERHAPSVYADRLVSEPGRKNGLYWPDDGGPPSPAGLLVARASDEGYTDGTDAAYHGYRYRLLKAQGPAAPGGAKSYVIDGQLVDGFAFVAWPAQYRASGVMTFIVNQEGVVYQKDLGEQTESAAHALSAYDPGEGWVRVDAQ